MIQSHNTIEMSDVSAMCAYQTMNQWQFKFKMATMIWFGLAPHYTLIDAIPDFRNLKFVQQRRFTNVVPNQSISVA